MGLRDGGGLVAGRKRWEVSGQQNGETGVGETDYEVKVAAVVVAGAAVDVEEEVVAALVDVAAVAAEQDTVGIVHPRKASGAGRGLVIVQKARDRSIVWNLLTKADREVLAAAKRTGAAGKAEGGS